MHWCLDATNHEKLCMCGLPMHLPTPSEKCAVGDPFPRVKPFPVLWVIMVPLFPSEVLCPSLLAGQFQKAFCVVLTIALVSCFQNLKNKEQENSSVDWLYFNLQTLCCLLPWQFFSPLPFGRWLWIQIFLPPSWRFPSPRRVQALPENLSQQNKQRWVLVC